jgi:hypothetical protein
MLEIAAYGSNGIIADSKVKQIGDLVASKYKYVALRSSYILAGNGSSRAKSKECCGRASQLAKDADVTAAVDNS